MAVPGQISMEARARQRRAEWTTAGVVTTVLLGFLAFAPALSGSWVWDDHAEIIDNPLVKDPAGWLKAWQGGAGMTDYFPLKSTLQWLEWRWWGDNPVPYRFTNIGLHLLSALLVWRLLRKLGCLPVAAWLGGLLFAVHPLTVESVAWIAEFKNAVSLPPLLIAAIAYVDFSTHDRRRDYVVALVGFIVAALCKTSVVMLPPVLLLFVWWRQRKLTSRDAKPVAPFFAVSLTLGVVTLWFQHARAIGTWDIVAGSVAERIGRAGSAVWFYLGKSILPVGLLPVYPRNVPAGSALVQIVAWLALAGVFFWSWSRRDRWGRHVILGGGWFLLHLGPVLGIATMAFLHFAWVADHFAYLSLIGVVGLAAAGWGSLWQTWRPARTGIAMGTAAVVAVALLASRRHAAHFQTEETLWRYTLARNPSAWVGHNNLAVALARQEKFADSLEHADLARQLKPDYGDAHANAASSLAHLGRIDEALAAAARAEQLGAASPRMYAGLGSALLRAGRIREALVALEKGLRLDPEASRLHKDYGIALFLAGNAAAAVEHYERGLKITADADTHVNCGVALMALDRGLEALRHYDAALRLAPDSIEAHYNRGIALARLGRLPEAQTEFETTVRLNPRHAQAYYNLGDVFRREGRTAEAASAWQTALRLEPKLEEARAALRQLGVTGP